MKENKFASKLTRLIRDCNGLVLSIVGNRMMQSGWPDIFVAHSYWIGFIEFKGEHTVLRKDQQFIIKRLKEKGVNVFIVRYPDLIQDELGNVLGVFKPSSGSSLLKELQSLS